MNHQSPKVLVIKLKNQMTLQIKIKAFSPRKLDQEHVRVTGSQKANGCFMEIGPFIRSQLARRDATTKLLVLEMNHLNPFKFISFYVLLLYVKKCIIKICTFKFTSMPLTIKTVEIMSF